MLPVGALCFYQAHFGRTVLPKWPFWAHLFYSVFYSVSELRRACFRQARVARAVHPPGALFRAGAFALPPCAPKSHMRPLPHLGVSDFCKEEYWSQSARGVGKNALPVPECLRPVWVSSTRLTYSGHRESYCITSLPFFAGVLRGNTIGGNTTRNSERKMAL